MRALGNAAAVATLPDGGFFVGNAFAGKVWRVSADGTASMVAASLRDVHALAVMPDGNLLAANRRSVLRVLPDGTISPFAGRTSDGGFAGDGGPATRALLDDPRALAVEPDGSVLIADSGNDRVPKVTPSGRSRRSLVRARGAEGQSDSPRYGRG